jgi:hypothetical protein
VGAQRVFRRALGRRRVRLGRQRLDQQPQSLGGPAGQAVAPGQALDRFT